MAEGHNECRLCQKRFGSKHELANVSISICNVSGSPLKTPKHESVHLPERYQCWACERRFRLQSAAYIHLESGTCESGIDCGDVLQCLLRCEGEWKNYADDGHMYPFRCPSCNRKFAYMSSFFQHFEGRLRDFECREGERRGCDVENKAEQVFHMLLYLKVGLGFGDEDEIGECGAKASEMVPEEPSPTIPKVRLPTFEGSSKE